ncbi:response regulator receiver protein [Gloeothece citriformis PCC 7424]|uniref:Response regulator receiver protein n=1 Tax=Gloeothece citriformis (strain PCC 7424) TaxID=65393 RepID=B7K8K0_GLOC7|nr:response regulator [Gloeothece citriformis]ACK71198.1 response regulator receiver protein [Gloeothece citriformis PCC 7424]
MGTALIVDDSLTEREIITHYLKQLGINVSTANSGEEALEKLNSQIPDLIVLDVVLPGRSGFEICRALKADTKTQKIPVILCSTKGSEMDKFWGLKQGADAYIPKPVDQELLLTTVKNLIKS